MYKNADKSPAFNLTAHRDVNGKTKRVRLKGKALRELNAAIQERDGYCCIICGRYVDPGEKFHHEPPGAEKSDEMGKGVTLCFDCHQERHLEPTAKR